MDNVREKLVELLKTEHQCPVASCSDCPYRNDEEYSCDSAAAAADMLIAHGVTVQEWIPVSERLPKEGDDVLVFGYWHEKWQPLICHLSPHFKGSWYTMPAGMQVYSVTHWMPLPYPPKGA